MGGKSKLSNTETLVLLAVSTAIVLAFVQQDINKKSEEDKYSKSSCSIHKVLVPFLSVQM